MLKRNNNIPFGKNKIERIFLRNAKFKKKKN